MRLILASTSPYRKALLARLGLPFEAVAPAFDELAPAGMSAEELVRRNALGKLEAVVGLYPDAVVVASDQAATCGEAILGKPGGFEAAFAQLRRMSGQRIAFFTGLAVGSRQGVHYETVPFYVQMRRLADREIEVYLEREQPFDCAGSFKSEGLGVALFDSMEGTDPTALIGLPLIALCRQLRPLQLLSA